MPRSCRSDISEFLITDLAVSQLRFSHWASKISMQNANSDELVLILDRMEKYNDVWILTLQVIVEVSRRSPPWRCC